MLYILLHSFIISGLFFEVTNKDMGFSISIFIVVILSDMVLIRLIGDEEKKKAE